MRSFRTPILCLFVAACQSTPAASSGGGPATTSTPARTTAALTTRSGIYTMEQATKGREIYNSICASCHTMVALTGPDFRRRWQGETLWSFFDNMRQTMPQNDPKSLPEADYAAATAYILSSMKMPAGSTAMPTDSMALSKIRIDTIAGSPASTRR